MFDNKIDVAKIMRDIKAQIEPEEVEAEVDGCSLETSQIEATINEINRIQSFIINTRNLNRGYLTLFELNRPSFTRFGKIPGKLFRGVAKVVRKCVEYLFRNQIIVNNSTDACIQALVESQAQLMKSFRYIELLSKKNYELERELAEIRADINKFKMSENRWNDLYVEFEDKYRGSEAVIKDRMQFYIDRAILPYIEKDSDDLILDLGCGRGEWLQLLRENGYDAVGVEVDPCMVSRCKEKEIQVIEKDALTYLRSISDNSVKLVTAFQVIEHVDINELEVLIEEIYRVLRKDGIVILETPNAANVEVGCYNFYLDPTHKKPVHSEFLKFIIDKAGFSETEFLYWKASEIENWWSEILEKTEGNLLESPLFRTILETIKTNFYSSPDYALMAKK